MAIHHVESLQRALLLAPLPLLLLLLYGLPLLGVVNWSFILPEPGIQNYQKVVSDPAVREVMLRTFRLCFTVTALALVLGYLVSYCWVFGSSRWQRAIEVAVFIPFWISVLVRAFGWLMALGTDGILNNTLIALGLIHEPLQMIRNELGVVIGMLHFMIPYAVFPLVSSMKRVDGRTLLASRGLGAGQLHTFWRVLIPQTLPGMLGAFIIVFVFCLGFFITPAILGGGQTVMAAEYVFLQMFQTSNWGLGAAISVFLLMIICALTFVLLRVTRVNKLPGN